MTKGYRCFVYSIQKCLFLLFQYFIDRKNLTMVGKEDRVEEYNRVALRIAREVAQERGLLFAGGVGNTNIFSDKTIADPETEIRLIHEQQVRWAKEEGVDYVIAETMSNYEEARIALEVIKSFDLPAVITLSPMGCNKDGIATTVDDVPIATACQRLLELGATLVGSNCYRGPSTMINIIEDIVKVVPPEKVCALPLGYRTTKEQPTWYDLKDPLFPENFPFTDGLNPFLVTEKEIVIFTKRCMELGVKYMGICCGNMGSLTRAMATTMGKEPFLSAYHDMEKLSKVMKHKNELRSKRLKEYSN